MHFKGVNVIRGLLADIPMMRLGLHHPGEVETREEGHRFATTFRGVSAIEAILAGILT